MAYQLFAAACIGCTPACSVDVSGLPEYLCVGDTALVGVVTSPDSLADSVSWTRNARLFVNPGTGPTRLARALEAGTGSVTATANADICTGADTDTVSIIANKVADYAQVQDTNACPERQQDEGVDHQIDGCSVPPGVLTVADFIVGPAVGFTDDVDNPVGGQLAVASTQFGQPQPPVPHGQDPIDLPCNHHDICYQTCGHARLGCDSGMDAGMAEVCETAYPATCPWTSALTCVEYFQEKARCFTAGDLYFLGVKAFGSGAYQQRQVEYCSCCPSS